VNDDPAISLEGLSMTEPGAEPYSDDEIHRLLRRAMAEEKQCDSAGSTTPIRAPTKLRSTSDIHVEHELSFDEILQKIMTEIANR